MASPTSTQSAIEPDDEALSDPSIGDVDSALGGVSIASTTTSLRQSLLDYREENGRTYHAFKAGAYFMPNDEIENDRLDLQHHIFLLAFETKLALAPIGKKLQRVLDVGCGTGIWAIDFADEHPEAEVIGVDLSATQPIFVPPNLKFEIDDLEEQWTFSYRFDYIHSRMMLGCFSNYPKFFQQSFEFLEPGGYIEAVDCAFPPRCDDDSLPEDSEIKKWIKLLLEASEKTNRPIDVVPRYRDMMLDAGFETVTEHQYKWPTNSWPKEEKYKELGLWCLENVMGALEAATYAPFFRILGWTKQEIDVFLVGVRRELKDRRIHLYWPIYVVYGRKPAKK